MSEVGRYGVLRQIGVVAGSGGRSMSRSRSKSNIADEGRGGYYRVYS